MLQDFVSFSLKINSLKSKKNFIFIKKLKKKGEKVASVTILDGELYPFRLSNNSSIFSTELKAIDLALNHIEKDAFLRYIIYTDSLSAMQALEGEKTDYPLVVILAKLSRSCERADLFIYFFFFAGSPAL